MVLGSLMLGLCKPDACPLDRSGLLLQGDMSPSRTPVGDGTEEGVGISLLFLAPVSTSQPPASFSTSRTFCVTLTFQRSVPAVQYPVQKSEHQPI